MPIHPKFSGKARYILSEHHATDASLKPCLVAASRNVAVGQWDNHRFLRNNRARPCKRGFGGLEHHADNLSRVFSFLALPRRISPNTPNRLQIDDNLTGLGRAEFECFTAAAGSKTNDTITALWGRLAAFATPSPRKGEQQGSDTSSRLRDGRAEPGTGPVPRAAPLGSDMLYPFGKETIPCPLLRYRGIGYKPFGATASTSDDCLLR